MPNKEMMGSLGKRLREARQAKGLSQRHLGAALGLHQSTLAGYEAGVRQPDNAILVRLAEVLDVSVDYLLGRTDHPKQTYSLSGADPETVDVPILGQICAGNGREPVEEIFGYEPTPRADVQGGEYFWLVVRGDSMSPRLMDGYKVLVRRQRVVEDGQVAVVCLPDTNDALVRRVFRQGRDLILVAENPAYPPIKTKDAWIMGIVKKFMGDI